jgi:hypothetical protein
LLSRMYRDPESQLALEVQQEAYTKSGSSRLSRRARSWWFIVISDQEHPFISIHPRPTTISSVPSSRNDLRVTKDEVASNKDFSDI